METPKLIRLRLILPVAFVGFSVTLWAAGELQASRTWERIQMSMYLEDLQLRKQLPNNEILRQLQYSTRGGGPITKLYQLATAWELDRAINAPAWIASMSVPVGFYGGGLALARIAPSAHMWLYWAFIAGMWFFLGHCLHKWRDQTRALTGRPRIWRRVLLNAILITYGILLCYRAQEYLSPSFELGILFPVSLFGWGIGLMFAGICPYSDSRLRLWRLFYGSLALLVGAAEWYCGYHFILRTLLMPEAVSKIIRPAQVTMLILFFVWGAVLILGGLYFLLPVRSRAVAG